MPKDQKELLRHFLVTLAYGTPKALRGAPEGFADFSAGSDTRTPRELVRHMASMIGTRRHSSQVVPFAPIPCRRF